MEHPPVLMWSLNLGSLTTARDQRESLLASYLGRGIFDCFARATRWRALPSAAIGRQRRQSWLKLPVPLIGAVRAAPGCDGPSVERAQVVWSVQTLDAFPAGLAAGFVVAQRPVSHDLSSGAVRQPAPALAAQMLVADSQTPILGHDALNLRARAGDVADHAGTRMKRLGLGRSRRFGRASRTGGRLPPV